jgi:hypothetical protein
MILRIGSTGSAVAQLQLTLNELAHAKHFSLPDGELKGTGTFGEKTENTVKAFQKKFALNVDGIAGPQTFEKIDELRGKLLRAARPATAAEKASREKLSGRLIEIAQREVGVREVGGNNCGVRVRDYQRATDLRPLGAWPWCGASGPGGLIRHPAGWRQTVKLPAPVRCHHEHGRQALTKTMQSDQNRSV